MVERIADRGDIGTFYAQFVHSHLRQSPEISLEKYRRRIYRELGYLGISKEALAGKVVLDIGSGFHSLVFSELGCRKIYHRDISHEQVAWLRDYCDQEGIRNINSECVDINLTLGEVPAYDIAFVYGIINHIKQPMNLLNRLIQSAGNHSDILIRCYRSDTWSRWLVAHLRTVVEQLDPASVIHEMRNQFPLEYLTDKQFVSDALDDLFTPIWHCFSSVQFAKDAEELGLHHFCPDGDLAAPFDMTDENFRIKLSVQKDTLNKPSSSLLLGCGINQLKLDYSLLSQHHFKSVWSRFVDDLSRCPPTVVATRIITLYRLARHIDITDYFTVSGSNLTSTSNIGLGERRIQALVDILSLWSVREGYKY